MLDKKWLVDKIPNEIRLKKMQDFLLQDGSFLQVSLANNMKMREDAFVVDLNDKHPLVDLNIDLALLHTKIPPNSYDYIICNAVLEHVRQPWLAIEALQSVLKPYGKIWIEVPFTWVHHTTAYVSHPDRTQNHEFSEGDYWRWTHEGLDLMFDICTMIEYFYATPVDAQSEDYMGLCAIFQKRG